MSDIFQWADILSAAIPAGAKKLFAALAALVCIDYITGLCVAIKEKKVSSKIGAKGLASKVTIFAMAALGMVIDHLVSGGGRVKRSFYYNKRKNAQKRNRILGNF